ncbi:Concanavalin A-like lectin/glucanase, subgroup [Kalmanozyma brasiliensis GHG001]|uniref:GH16 domain-containing protein n=1 Tax=Kalmanozyma brasiliensis (strain GHG001) TaxID=1365824 RepID=V5EUT0_KALBG|nr:Concanavalin A-like lectin/glucanase, subgroup [Kalmanozyma brasiliensis GHG001]EST09140.1 Concanavalin A-like lectin/glucanase, subgroup [Kalmanozyma brasiliensis GHG001]
MKYLSALVLAFAASVSVASAGHDMMVAIPPGQGRSSRGIRSVITGHKIRSHGHHTRRQAHHDDELLDRRFSNATLNADEQEVAAIAASHKKKRGTCTPRSTKNAAANYKAGASSGSSSASSSSSASQASASGSSGSNSNSNTGTVKATSQGSSSGSSSSSNGPSTSQWKLVKSYSGSTFFDDMDFFTMGDPTHGSITYVDRNTAQNQGLIGTNNGQVTMKINPGNGWAQSVRINTKDSFTTGIFVLDAEHMPVGCGIWPAWWSTPTNPAGGWPNGGEIDIIEGVNDYSYNTYSVHTTGGCNVPQNPNMKGKFTLQDWRATNCASDVTGNQGCGVTSTTNGDFGVNYNNNGGGVHVMYWSESDGISTYFFPKGSVPNDISTGSPDPSNWGQPQAHWPATNCNIGNYFYNHVVVFTNTVCGDWAGSGDVWWNAMNGQSQSCAAKTGQSSCQAYLNSNPDFSQAYWTINSLKIYQTSRRS